jgi:hypothetical protein
MASANKEKESMSSEKNEDHQPETLYLEHDVLWAAPIYGEDEEWCVRTFAASAVTSAQENADGHAHIYVIAQGEQPDFVIASRRPLTRKERQRLLEDEARLRAGIDKQSVR